MPVATSSPDKVKICIDRGGTFCDVVALSESKGSHTVKLLSVDPSHYPDAPREGVRRVLEWFTGKTIPRDEPIDTSAIEYLRMGTTVATNALLERKGERCALLITKGFRDALEIGTQTRPFLFQLAIKKPDVLYTKVVEIDERVTPEWIEHIEDPPENDDYLGQLVEGVNGSKLRVVQAIDTTKVQQDLQGLYDEGYRSIAIVLAHSYVYPVHEKQVEAIAQKIGFPHISVSSDLQAMINMVSRGASATADTYLTPEVRRYLASFSAGFKDQLQSADSCRVSFMQSDGSLCDFRKFSGLRAILSGPAGGVVGYARTGYDQSAGTPVVGFDMGGTSTDVSRFGGQYEHVFETTTAGITIQTPQLDINTVAAGGGSILTYKNGLFQVGPESAGAHPGPACYRKGGPLTVTDANLFLGRLHIDSFPRIFGSSEDMPLDYEVVKKAFDDLTARINKETGMALTPYQVASGFIDVANTSMARPIRALTEQRGFQTSNHNLSSFGGAGGQHACALASILGMHNVIIHKYSSVLSAYGMALADVAVDLSEPLSIPYSAEAFPLIGKRLDSLKATGEKELLAQGVPLHRIEYECYLNMRYNGSDTKLMILRPADDDYAAAFENQHKREFAFGLDTGIAVENVRVRAIGRGEDDHDDVSFVTDLATLPEVPVASKAHFAQQEIFFEESDGFQMSPLYRLHDLAPGTVVQGPALILDNTQTILLHPQNKARILHNHVYVDVGLGDKKRFDTESVDPIQLSIFSHRFMGIAEQMGRALQKTSISVQIKERLDFSCAIFGHDAALVANAPNVPVHLGSMEYAVRAQAEMHKGKLRHGDILVANHPKVGGTHLPDITVMQPIFAHESSDEIVFWVAARGHHADIGGLEGHSMHPRSTDSFQEGAAIMSEFLVRDGVFLEKNIRDIFAKAGEYPDCIATRQIDVNLSDLKAQCSACAVGSTQITALFKEYGQSVVQHYMAAIRANAELSVRDFLKTRIKKELYAEDFMVDDGTVIRLRIDINKEDGSAVFDFTGTGPESLSNLNAPESVTRSALIYSLRTLIGTDMPLNSGVLAPIDLVIPSGSFLSPSLEAAVCAGNTETSQRVVDTIFKAFEACAASQGTMNVIGTGFNYKKWSYGETICGGAGAGPTWEGQSAVQINMTNTRIGDVEIAETRFPLLLREFSIRRGSGGQGQHIGGDGVHREYEARVPMEVAHIGERRVNQPYGMHGGEPGQRGAMYWKRRRQDGGYRIIKAPPSSAINMQAGDSIVIHTPGGGGYGAAGGSKPNGVSVQDVVPAAVVPSRKTFPRANGSLSEYAATQESCD
ncbi:5-oxoprolinase (ATP-hydrolysing) [Kwoniella heveanensis BCC8398]|uniref:5-oxoprolinase (ATP-hydrolysing) n=1 Tax=Kwoniella heveanensis BCC8398 TaxID=1296120 RepID=A0A1B9GLY6_9TREE|nr:5-oxoprolinase (ATP-hydrolysing) [Kwoniella heveanensis BCC8398]